MKCALLIILLILLLPIVLADQGDIEIYKPNEVIDLSVHLTNKTGEVIAANCSVQIKNESYGVILNTVMEEIGNGWYNLTYNTSRVGNHFCRYNCTQGTLYVAETCDFIIVGDAQMPIAVILVVIFVMVFYFVLLINLFTERAFTEHGLIKLMFIMIAFWALLLPINMAVQYNDANGGPAVVTEHLETLYMIMVWLNSFIVLYFMLWFIVQMLKKIGVAKTQ